jgi:hypothetical protein
MRPRAALAVLAPFGVTLLLLALLALPTRSADKPAGDLKAKVKGLVEQLADKDPDKQDAAAAELINLGPDVLPFLPRPGDKVSDAQKKALAVIRKTLRDQQIQRDLAARPVTLDGEYTLGKALAELAAQSGTKVEDRREAGDDPQLKLKLTKVTFWEAIDTIAREADARVGVWERDGKIALRARPPNAAAPPASYNGIFRTTVKRISAVRNFEVENSGYLATLEIAWEPRFRPFLVELDPKALSFQDDKKRSLALEEMEGETEKNKLAVSHRTAVTFDIPLPSLQRASAKLGLLKGNVQMVGPTRMDTFAFKSTLAEMEKDPRARELTQNGVTVKVSKLDLPKDHWTLVMALEYPADGPQFESFESWLVYNEIELRKKDGSGVFPNNAGYSIDDSAGNRAILSYNFVDGKTDKRGSPDDWTVVYKTPGLIVDVPVAFEFKDLPLP